MVCRLSYALLEGCRGRWGTLQSPVSTHAHTEQSVPYTNVRSTSPRTLKESLQSYRCIGTILLRLLFSNRFHTVIQYYKHSLYQHKQSFACQICYKRNDCTTGHCISLVYMSTPDERNKIVIWKALVFKQHTGHHKAKHLPHIMRGGSLASHPKQGDHCQYLALSSLNASALAATQESPQRTSRCQKGNRAIRPYRAIKLSTALANVTTISTTTCSELCRLCRHKKCARLHACLR